MTGFGGSHPDVTATVAISLPDASGVTAGLPKRLLLLVVPLLVVLRLWQAVWSAVPHRFAAPSWLIALVGSLVVAWPIATALPLVS